MKRNGLATKRPAATSGDVIRSGKPGSAKNGQTRRPSQKDAARGAVLTLRPARESDLVPLGFFFDTVLRKDYFLRRGQLEDLVRGPYHQVYIAEIDAVLVGVAITTRGTRLVNALVHPAYRGLGIGKALVEASGATQVRAKLDMSTGDPRGFYFALGFQSTGERNGKGNIELLQKPTTGTTKQRGNGTTA